MYLRTSKKQKSKLLMRAIYASILLLTLFLLSSKAVLAQVPSSVINANKGEFYGNFFTSFKPGSDHLASSLSFNYGVFKHLEAGIKLSASRASVIQGINLKYKYSLKKHFQAAIQTTSYFDIKNRFNYAHQTTGLLFKGAIAKGFGYSANSWMTNHIGGDLILSQMWYLTYKYDWFVTYVGMTHSWLGKFSPDLAIGLCFKRGNFNFLAWGGELTSKSPLVTIGVEFVFATK